MELQDRTHVESGLYAASAGQLLARLRAVDDRVASVLVIAHNPGLQVLALELAGDDPEMIIQLQERFPTGALAEVIGDCTAWSKLTPATAHVASLVVPRDLPKH